jgi:hypothetical protein
MKSFAIRVPKESGFDIYSFPEAGLSSLLKEFAPYARLSVEFVSPDLCVLTAHVKLLGGKGGFGRLLRSQKNTGKKTDNFDSCRDLEGRREGIGSRSQRLEELKAKESEKKKSVQFPQPEKRNPVTLDDTYIKKLAEIRKEREYAVLEGIKALSSGFPRDEPVVKRLKKTAFDDDSD